MEYIALQYNFCHTSFLQYATVLKNIYSITADLPTSFPGRSPPFFIYETSFYGFRQIYVAFFVPWSAEVLGGK